MKGCRIPIIVSKNIWVKVFNFTIYANKYNCCCIYYFVIEMMSGYRSSVFPQFFYMQWSRFYKLFWKSAVVSRQFTGFVITVFSSKHETNGPYDVFLESNFISYFYHQIRSTLKVKN